MFWLYIRNNKYLLLTVAVITAFIVFKIPYLQLPFFWDEAWVYGPAVRLMAKTGISFAPDALPVDLSRGHPLLFHVLNAAWLEVFGNTLLSVHIFNLLVSCALVFVTYLFGKKYYSAHAGFAAAFALCLQPVFLAQSTLVLPEVMLSLFCLLALYFYLQQKYVGYFLSACAATLTKETGIAIIISSGLLYLIIERRKATSNLWVYLLGLFKTLLPVGPLVIFLAFQYKLRGWFLFQEHIDFITYNLATIRQKFFNKYLVFTFLLQGRNLLFFAMIISLIWMIYKKQKIINNLSIPGILLFIIIYALLGSLNFFSKRYILCIIPPFIILSLGLTIQSFKNKYLLPVFLLVYFLTQIKYINNKTNSDHNLGLINVVKANQSMIDFCLKSGLKDEKLSAFFISNIIMTNPLSGYINDDEIFTKIQGDSENSDYFIFSNFDTSDKYLKLRARPDQLLVKRFEYGRAWIELYKKRF